VALRRAIALAYDVDNEIRVLRRGEATPATQIILPRFARARSNAESACYDPAAARSLLDKFGYKTEALVAIELVQTGRHLCLSSVHRRTAKAGSSMSCGNEV
jgi:ABC-type transport system substrate-binding protein